MELELVMRGGYGYSRGEVAAVIDHLMGLDNVTVENWDMVNDALRAYKNGMDFADTLHLAASQYEMLATFDAKFAKQTAKLGL